MEKKWNPLYSRETTASVTECTGLQPTPPSDEEQADAYGELYAITRQKPIHATPEASPNSREEGKKRK